MLQGQSQTIYISLASQNPNVSQFSPIRSAVFVWKTSAPNDPQMTLTLKGQIYPI